EVIGHIRKSRAGPCERALDRIEDDRNRLAHVFEIAITRIGEQQRKRQDAEEREPRERTRAPIEERRSVDGNGAHGVRDDFASTSLSHPERYRKSSLTLRSRYHALARGQGPRWIRSAAQGGRRKSKSDAAFLGHQLRSVDALRQTFRRTASHGPTIVTPTVSRS